MQWKRHCVVGWVRHMARSTCDTGVLRSLNRRRRISPEAGVRSDHGTNRARRSRRRSRVKPACKWDECGLISSNVRLPIAVMDGVIRGILVSRMDGWFRFHSTTLGGK